MAKIQDALNTELGSDAEPLKNVQYDAEYNVFANERQHFDQPESINDTYVVEKDDSNVIPDSSDMCVNDNQADQNNEECDDERVVLTNLIANLKLDTDENKNIQKQLKKANASHTHELQECKSALEKCKSSLEESNRTRYKYLGALNDQVVELAKYKRLNDCTLENDRLERKLKETLGLLAQKEIDSKEVLKTKGYEISVEKEKNNKLVKQSSLTTLRYERLIKVHKTYKEKNSGTSCLLAGALVVSIGRDCSSSSAGSRGLLWALCGRHDAPSRGGVVGGVSCKWQGGRVTAPRLPELVFYASEPGCTKHMTGNLKLLYNFIEKYLGIVRFRNDQFALILGYGDLVQGNIMIKRVYYVEDLNHNLFLVGQFCDADLEVHLKSSRAQKEQVQVFIVIRKQDRRKERKKLKKTSSTPHKLLCAPHFLSSPKIKDY
ncbi:hypothetical protein Tco_0827096 [Tanacetum coccineum]